MILRRSLLSFALIATLLAGCADAPRPVHVAPAAPAKPPRDEVTAAAIERALAGNQRSAANRARDAYRHPLDTLLFFGIKPGMTVVEVWPGAGGWYTEVLAPLLREGKLYTALMPPAPGNEYVMQWTSAIRRQARFSSRGVRQGHGDARWVPATSTSRHRAARTWC